MLTESIVKPYIESFKNYVDKNISEYKSLYESQNEHFLDKEMEKYLRKMKTNYYMKSILYRDSGQYIYDVYVDIPLSNYQQEYYCRDILNEMKKGYLEEENEANYILVSGIGGSGKSILLKKMFLDLVTGDTVNHLFIPILIRLKSLKNIEKGFFQSYLFSYFSDMNVSFDESIV